VRGLWADQYKQAAIGVATSTSTSKGFVPLNFNNYRKSNDEADGNNKQSPNNRKH